MSAHPQATPVDPSPRPDLTLAERRELQRLIETSPRRPPVGAAKRPLRVSGPTDGLDLVERGQLASLGHLERLCVPSTNPLELVAPRIRAVAVLVALRENPARVGQVLLDAPRATAARQARAAFRKARKAILPAPLRLDTRRRARLARIVANDRHRWVLLLRASGAFASVDEIADALQMHRASTYRDLQHALTAVIAAGRGART